MDQLWSIARLIVDRLWTRLDWSNLKLNFKAILKLFVTSSSEFDFPSVSVITSGRPSLHTTWRWWVSIKITRLIIWRLLYLRAIKVSGVRLECGRMRLPLWSSELPMAALASLKVCGYEIAEFHQLTLSLAYRRWRIWCGKLLEQASSGIDF